MGVPAAVNPRIFRLDHRPYRRIAYCLTLMIAPIVVAIGGGDLRDWPFCVLTAIVLYPFTDLYCRLVLRFFPTKVTDQGIYGYSFWSLPRFLEWREIATVRPWRLATVRFLRLYPPNRRSPIWLPLFLIHPILFREEVWTLAPPDNPLSRFLGRGAHPQDIVDLTTG